MAYNQKALDTYRADSLAGTKPFKSRTCPYCNGQRDPTPKHTHPSTKPANPWDFVRHVLLDKYRGVQSVAATQNMSVKLTSQEAITTGSSDKLFVVGPMVDQSELPFRMLCRQLGSNLAYTPMLHAKSFAESAHYRSHFFTTTPVADVATRIREEEKQPQQQQGGTGIAEEERLVDRPVIVQFCGHDADTVLAAARLAVCGEDESKDTLLVNGERYYRCDAVDLNLGCPQGIAKRGHYGSFLMEDWELIHTIIHTLHVELEVPVTAKIRVFDKPTAINKHTQESTQASASVAAESSIGDCEYDEELTIRYARMVRDAGAQLLCVHGRTREMKGQQSGLANMRLIGRVREALADDSTGRSIPVIANGNVQDYRDVLDHLVSTACVGHMCAEPLLWDPALFVNPPHPVPSGRLHGADKATRLAALDTALCYARWLRRCPVDMGFAKAHIFKMCFHSYELHTEFRNHMADLSTAGGGLLAAENTEEKVDVGNCCTLPAREQLGGSAVASSAEDAAAEPVEKGSYERHVDALETHLRALREAEVACDVKGEQPKAARAAKSAAKAQVVDVFEEEGDIGINF